jgi:hypothetical protein
MPVVRSLARGLAKQYPKGTRLRGGGKNGERIYHAMETLARKRGGGKTGTAMRKAERTARAEGSTSASFKQAVKRR